MVRVKGVVESKGSGVKGVGSGRVGVVGVKGWWSQGVVGSRG